MSNIIASNRSKQKFFKSAECLIEHFCLSGPFKWELILVQDWVHLINSLSNMIPKCFMSSVNHAFRKNALAFSHNLQKFSRGSAPGPRERRHFRLNIYCTRSPVSRWGIFLLISERALQWTEPFSMHSTKIQALTVKSFKIFWGLRPCKNWYGCCDETQTRTNFCEIFCDSFDAPPLTACCRYKLIWTTAGYRWIRQFQKQRILVCRHTGIL